MLLIYLIVFITGFCVLAQEHNYFTLTQSYSKYAFSLYAYDEQSVAKADKAIVIGVGTAMKSTQYSELSKTIVDKNRNVIVIFIDHNSGSITKTDGLKFASTFQSVVNYMKLSTNPVFNPRVLWYVGGHSAAGQAVIQAFKQNLWTGALPSGTIMLDPYGMGDSSVKGLNISSMIWQSNVPYCSINVLQSCGVCPGSAGDAVYSYVTTGSRKGCYNYALYDYSDNTNHCVYSDSGCLFPLSCDGSGEISKSQAFTNIAESIVHYLSGDFQGDKNNTSIFQNAKYRTKKLCNV